MHNKINTLINNVEKVIVGKREVVEIIVAAMLSNGHVLIEDVPGVGKTQLATSLAKSCGGEFGRVQMTPDVMPTDITGFNMINPINGQMEFKKGIAFCNFLLADEINRSSPKSQSALLEIMEENQVTVDGNTYEVKKPFMVLATQNPVETFGTYHLPEAQMDRFLIKIGMGYPEKMEEMDILMRNENNVVSKNLTQVITCEDIIACSEAVKDINCSPAIMEYIVDIVETTRTAEFIKLGVSPRGSIALYKMAKAYVFVKGRTYVTPDDIKKLVPYVLGHRIMLTSKGKTMFANNEEAIDKLVRFVDVPV